MLLLVGAATIGGAALAPGLLGLGFALGRLRVPEALEHRPRAVAVAFAVAATGAGLLAVLLLSDLDVPLVPLVGNVWAISMAIAYASGLVLLLHTPLGRPLSAVLAPMGRMALTNYLSATALFLVLGPVIGIDGYEDGGRIVVLTIGINALQAAWSRWWLARFDYGPMEWLWRCLTWGQRAPIRTRAMVS